MGKKRTLLYLIFVWKNSKRQRMDEFLFLVCIKIIVCFLWFKQTFNYPSLIQNSPFVLYLYADGGDFISEKS